MEGWKEGTIKSVASIGNGRDYKHLKEGNVPVFGTGGYMTSVNDFLYDGETVCIGRKGTIDTPLYHSGKIWTVDTLFYTHSFDNILPKLLFYIFQTIDWKKYNEATGVPSLSKKTIEQIKINFPESEVEQSKITTILNTIDSSIARTEQLIAKYKNIKQGLMHDLLTYGVDEKGSIRNPLTHSFVEKYGMMVPEEWDVVDFESVSDKKIKWSITGGPFGSNLKSSDYTNQGIPIIQLQNIGDGVFIEKELIFTSIRKANELLSSNIYPNEIILSKMGDPVARACIIPNTFDRYLMCSDGIRFVVDKQKFSNLFVFYYINYDIFRAQALNSSSGSTRKRIGLTTLKKLFFPKPSLSEQENIVKTLRNQDKLIESEQINLAKLQKLKQGLMEDLLTGKVRVKI